MVKPVTLRQRKQLRKLKQLVDERTNRYAPMKGGYVSWWERLLWWIKGIR